VPFGVDEYTCAGALAQAPVRLVRCQTIPLEVPAAAEIVIEGNVLPGVLEEEGPYDEFTGYAMPAAKKPVIAVTAVTRRRDPIYQDVMGGGAEHLLLGSIPKAATLDVAAAAEISLACAPCVAAFGCGRLHAVVSSARSSLRGAEADRGVVRDGSFLKHVWVVDATWTWTATATCSGRCPRLPGDRDMVVETGQPGTDLDPSAENGTRREVGFDCRRKNPVTRAATPSTPPPLEKMSPERWLAPEPPPRRE